MFVYEKDLDFQLTIDYFKRKTDSKFPYFPEVIDWSDKQILFEKKSIRDYLEKYFCGEDENKGKGFSIIKAMCCCGEKSSEQSLKNINHSDAPLPKREPDLQKVHSQIEISKKYEENISEENYQEKHIFIYSYIKITIIYNSGEIFFEGLAYFDPEERMLCPVSDNISSENVFCENDGSDLDEIYNQKFSKNNSYNKKNKQVFSKP